MHPSGMKLKSMACMFGGAALLAACAALAPTDELTWSSALARTLPLEEGPVVEVARFSELRPGATYLGEWEPWAVLEGGAPTDYRLVESDGVVVVEADSGPEGTSAFFRRIRIDPHRTPIIEWRWRVPRDSGTGAVSAASPPVRLSLAFDGDPAKLDFDDRAKLRLAKALTANGLPYASLLYVWLNSRPAESIYSSPHTERVRFVVVESGEQRLDRWLSVRRNVLEDYRRAFGEEPGDIVAVGIMTDYGDNGGGRRAQYGDITFRQP
jgi:hypothetical protein